ncbi:universal stress protein [Aureispira anguillae]|uniref:Universal stress protein n=1 Tax=Aureispira anguillae TaxID=2864201 RepID=A0A916DS78_9BACT|nr:universal stress protein [Aureispira anguillae]BDS11706.1 universal stress protein [Aureispira anguillae]
MEKILVPFDFSVSSSWGFYYAYELAASIGAQVLVVNMYSPATEATYSLEKLQANAPKRKQEILAHLKAATQRPISSANDTSVTVTYDIDYGLKDDIANYAKRQKVDLIVMGTHGGDKTTSKLWGSNTSLVIKEAHCPVLAIPVGSTFKAAQNIAYATNFDSKDIDSIAQLAVVAAATNSTVHCIHVNLFSETPQLAEGAKFEEQLKANFGDLPVVFNVWSAHTVEDGLEIFCRVNNIDILAMLTHDRSAWDKLFGEKSVTRAMALRTKLPLLAFHE